MIDTFSLVLTHALMLLAAWRLLARPDLDDADAPTPVPGADRRWGPETLRDPDDA